MNKLIGFVLISPMMFILSFAVIYATNKSEEENIRWIASIAGGIVFLLFIWAFYFFI